MKQRTACIAAIVIVSLFVAFSLHRGVPALRHDWGIPATADGWKAFGISAFSGWDARGIGEPQPYPTLFVLGPILAVIGLTFGSQIALGVFLAAIAAAFVTAGMRLGKTAVGNSYLGLAIGTALLFSPWAYEKLVAGHLTMLLSVGCCALLASEFVSRTPRRWVIVICSYVAAFQIQYALIVVIFSLAVRLDWRTLALTGLGSAMSLLPSIVGIVLAYSSLMGIPYTLPWQYANSVAPQSAILLDGYSQSYTAGSYVVFQSGSMLLVAVALAGCIMGVLDKKSRTSTLRIVALVAITVFFVSGLRGPFAGLYLRSLHIRETLVFRELFDLVGVLGVIYALLVTQACVRSRLLQYCVGASAGIMLAAWFLAPPWNWFVASKTLPTIDVKTTASYTRFALLPPRQPLRFQGAGSGADPDDYSRDRNVTPVNTYSPTFPGEVALAEYTRFNDVRDLEALSVSKIYDRPYFDSNIEAIQIARPIDQDVVRGSGTGPSLNALPELSLVAVPPDRDTPAPIHIPYLLYGGNNSTLLHSLTVVRAPLAFTDPRKGWVDADLTMSRFPRMASSLGGAFTLNPTAPLTAPIPIPKRALVFVRGVLLSGNGRRLARATDGWQWVPLRGAATLRCHGICAVAAWERRPYLPSVSGITMNPGVESVPFRSPLPFIAFGRLPGKAPTDNRLLLFRTKYDPSWRILGVPASHVQVSSIFNGYILRGNAAGSAFLIFEMTSVLQALAMVCSLAGVTVLAAYRPNLKRIRARWRADAAGGIP